MQELKKLVAIHDLSCFGKCSLTVALPVISAAGVECACIPTAVLSTHTGVFTGFTFRDLSEDIEPIAKHWQRLGLKFDAIYAGYMGSPKQAELVLRIIGMLKNDNTVVIIDPVMADDGDYYSNLDIEMCKGFRKLCKAADIITPNFTEAALLLGEEYKKPPYTKGYVEGLLKRLADLGAGKVVLTGVAFNKDEVGAACYDKTGCSISYALGKRIPGVYHGTGDLFSSAFSASIVRGIPMEKAIRIAVDLVKNAVERTYIRGTPTHYGVDFEGVLTGFLKDIEENCKD
jgi:pyridoxine kinase